MAKRARPTPPPADKEALLSECKAYRYWLLRQWDWGLRPVCFVLLNPSTADHETDDPTVKKCCRLARAWGAGGIEVVNLFAFRATKPKNMAAAADPVGPENDVSIREAVISCSPTVLGWGNSVPKAHLARVEAVLTVIRRSGCVPKCLAVTGEGQPQHPLYFPETPVPVLKPFPEVARG